MKYPALELGQAGNEKCPDKYTEASTLDCPRAKRLILQVSKNNVMIQVGKMLEGVGASVGSVRWQSEEPYLAGTAWSLGREFDAVRVRNWKAGSEAEVFLTVG